MVDWCDNCGLCCMTMRTPPFLAEDFARLSAELQQEIDQWLDSPRFTASVAANPEDAPCIWLDLSTGKCRHYEHRPQVCRDFAVGGDTCRSWRQTVGLTIEGMPVVDESEADDHAQ